MKINTHDWEAMLDLVGIDDDQITRKYSGRAMYGETCYAISIEDLNEAFELMAAAGHDLRGDQARELALSARTDQWVKGLILYFPGLEITEDVPSTSIRGRLHS